MGKRGVFTIPARMRKMYGFTDGSPVLAQATTDGILLRLVEAIPVEIYTDERIAEFLLTNSGDAKEYYEARQEVIEMGLDPDKIVDLAPIK